MMADGQLNREQMQGWVINRYYYQIHIPLKDAAILSNCPPSRPAPSLDPAHHRSRRWRRQRWRHRGLAPPGRGGRGVALRAWKAWTKSCPVCASRLRPTCASPSSTAGRRRSVPRSRSSSRRAPTARGSTPGPSTTPGSTRPGWPTSRPASARRGEDVRHGLEVTLTEFRTRPEQERALATLRFKLDVLWTMLDAMYLAYVIDMPPYQAIPAAEGTSEPGEADTRAEAGASA